ncbi:tRNA (adenosine(37)-N6)-threonylcarbamoyltransferase complex ATPase subunit type 1 TsaE [Actibacterium sp. 188UL27-1]|uniref:tRNA (adenosine(37)-N6)-threonylcarbamoyltransferase complex ATPase subunit type 1 TsaE n=1 Tax=Actibacterium sp. 188UL27-1 TaxID=2786961 RepID=UPI00195A1AFE|nr:tRNA (adenosine(37)-N6)-threonylcarbamoyltransferase complex ATPase subunit type 1 TsaE [Actibacterium sp. 188UL27-1]MBM7067228.1 tRNA (adenosine(37)-N6)-threonylcarbamoyltransferase complex ATPase subunit type 1 TsaE [Actibacterium sp. 188UL27-1]
MIIADPLTQTLILPDAEATTRLGQTLAPLLGNGDTLLLAGPIGAGKSHLARAIILSKLAGEDRVEDVPSPTYTLVQTYDTTKGEIWHTDLYRLGDPGEVYELGLDEAFEAALCLVEWPDRLGRTAPAHALSVEIALSGTGRRLTLSAQDPKWAALLATTAQCFG